MRLCLSLLVLLGLVSGCDSLSEFRGSFSGGIISGSFVRSCFQENLRAELRFDPDLAVITEQQVSDLQRNWLTLATPGESGEVVLDAPLEPVSLLSNDTLADFDFPGPKRLRSYMLLARPKQGPLAGRDALVVVSLLANKQVELRVIARGAETTEACPGEGPTVLDAQPRIREYYGFFRLK